MSAIDPEFVRNQHRYEMLTWPEINEAVAQEKVVVLPVAAIEQHGHHLPIDVDAKLATSVCLGAGEKSPGVTQRGQGGRGLRNPNSDPTQTRGHEPSNSPTPALARPERKIGCPAGLETVGRPCPDHQAHCWRGAGIHRGLLNRPLPGRRGRAPRSSGSRVRSALVLTARSASGHCSANMGGGHEQLDHDSFRHDLQRDLP